MSDITGDYPRDYIINMGFACRVDDRFSADSKIESVKNYFTTNYSPRQIQSVSASMREKNLMDVILTYTDGSESDTLSYEMTPSPIFTGIYHVIRKHYV